MFFFFFFFFFFCVCIFSILRNLPSSKYPFISFFYFFYIKVEHSCVYTQQSIFLQFTFALFNTVSWLLLYTSKCSVLGDFVFLKELNAFFFVVLLVCKSVERSSFCMKRVSKQPGVNFKVLNLLRPIKSLFTKFHTKKNTKNTKLTNSTLYII